jgi:hypothetical protein
LLERIGFEDRNKLKTLLDLGTQKNKISIQKLSQALSKASDIELDFTEL